MFINVLEFPFECNDCPSELLLENILYKFGNMVLNGSDSFGGALVNGKNAFSCFFDDDLPGFGPDPLPFFLSFVVFELLLVVIVPVTVAPILDVDMLLLPMFE